MANQSNSNKWLVVVVLLAVAAGYFYLNQDGNNNTENASTETVIADGIYRLTKERTLKSATCNLSVAHFGKTIVITGKKAYTTVLQEMTYDIFNKGGNAFQIGPATATCIYSNNKLTFMCQGEEIIFSKE